MWDEDELSLSVEKLSLDWECDSLLECVSFRQVVDVGFEGWI
jgi:hypothetical protein